MTIIEQNSQIWLDRLVKILFHEASEAIGMRTWQLSSLPIQAFIHVKDD